MGGLWGFIATSNTPEVIPSLCTDLVINGAASVDAPGDWEWQEPIEEHDFDLWCLEWSECYD